MEREHRGTRASPFSTHNNRGSSGAFVLYKSISRKISNWMRGRWGDVNHRWVEGAEEKSTELSVKLN